MLSFFDTYRSFCHVGTIPHNVRIVVGFMFIRSVEAGSSQSGTLFTVNSKSGTLYKFKKRTQSRNSKTQVAQSTIIEGVIKFKTFRSCPRLYLYCFKETNPFRCCLLCTSVCRLSSLKMRLRHDKAMGRCGGGCQLPTRNRDSCDDSDGSVLLLPAFVSHSGTICVSRT